MSIRRYRYRATPTGAQERALNQLFGCTRLVYNLALAHVYRDWEHGLHYRGATVLQREVLTLGKSVRPFLTTVSGVPLIQAVRDADRALRNYFDSCTGKRRGPKMGRPRFKSKKHHRDSARFTSAISAGGIRVRAIPHSRWGEVFLPKIGWLRFHHSRPLPSQPTSATVIREPDGHIYCSFTVRVPDTPQPAATQRPVAGVDLGVTDLAAIAASDGTRTKIAAPKHLRRKERQLARAQRELARRQRGSRNREKSRKRVARIHRRVRDTRLDAHHKLALQLVRENQTVVLETLSITGMVRNPHLAKSIHDAAWGTLVRCIEEKAPTHGCTIVRVGQFYPSSKTCSHCGQVTDRLPLHVRHWVCPACNHLLDRDWNAAANLVAVGLTETQNACGERNPTPPIPTAMAGLGLVAFETPDPRSGKNQEPTEPNLPLRQAV